MKGKLDLTAYVLKRIAVNTYTFSNIKVVRKFAHIAKIILYVSSRSKLNELLKLLKKPDTFRNCKF